MLFFLTLEEVIAVWTIEQPIIPIENPTKEEIWSRDASIESYFICMNLILNGLIDKLYDYYSPMSTTKEVWDALKKKYNTKEVESKKYAISRYLWYQMTADKSV